MDLHGAELTKVIHQGSVELASLNKKERRKFNFYHRVVQDVDDNFLKVFTCTCIPVENCM